MASPVVVTIDEAVSRALAVEPELAAATYNRRALSSDAQAAQTRFLPTFTASADYTRNGKLPVITFGGRNFEAGARDVVDLTGRVDQPVFTGGRLTSEIRIAEISRDAGKLRVRAKEHEIVARTRDACYEVMRASSLHKAAMTALLSSQAHRKDAEARVRAGMTAGVEVIRAEVRVQEAALDETAKRNRLALATSKLATLIGLSTATPVEVADSLPAGDLQKPPGGGTQGAGPRGRDLPASRFPLADPEATALATRPDLLAVRAGSNADAFRVSVARAGYFPNVTAFGAVSYQDDNTRHGTDSWKLGLSSDWEIFNWGRTQNQVDAAAFRSQASLANVKDYEDDVRIQVREAVLAISTARESIDLAESRVKAAAEDLRISRLRFTEGVGTGTEVIDAETDHANAVASQINARADFASAQNRYWFVTGGDQ